jgi:hypothetical protein
VKVGVRGNGTCACTYISFASRHFRHHGKDHSRAVKGNMGGSYRLTGKIHLGNASGLLDIPQADRPIPAGRQKHVFPRVQARIGHDIGMASEFAKYFIVVQGPIMNRMLLSLVSSKQNTMVVMSII